MDQDQRNTDGPNPSVITSEGNNFSLGFEGEFSFPGLPNIVYVPLSVRFYAPLDAYKHPHIMVTRQKDGTYNVVTSNRAYTLDDLLMVACLVRGLIDEYKTLGQE